MRYVRYKTIISKIVDYTTNDIAEIKSILAVIHSKSIDCTIQINGPRLESVRVTDVRDDDFDYVATRRTNVMKGSATYADLQYLELNTNDALLANLKPEMSRWLMLDSTDFADSETPS